VCWDKEEVMKTELKDKCREALIDFYRLQKQIEDGAIYLLDTE
jgi:hypothetical protein